MRRASRRACALSDRGRINELEERRGPLNAAFDNARSRWEALAEHERGSDAGAREEEVSSTAYALRILTMMRAQLPTATHDAPVALVGPGTTISGLVRATARAAVDDLAELIRESPRTDQAAQAKLSRAATAAIAWVHTYIDCEALEWFNFDPDWDPVLRTE